MFEKPRQGSHAGSAPPHVTIGARELVESAPDIIFCCDAEGRFQWLNSAVESHLGRRATDLLGSPFLAMVVEAERGRLARLFLGQRRRRQELVEADVPLMAGDGREVLFNARVRRVERPDGEVLFIGCARPAAAWAPAAGAGSAGPGAPVTAGLVGATDEWAGGAGAGAPAPALRPQAGGSGAQAADLTARLDEARSEAELKTVFLNTMSEELRTPIHGILGMSQLLLETELDADQRSFIEVIQNSSRALLNLVNDTLDFTRLEGDALDVRRIDFDLRHTVEEVAALVAPLANERGLGLDCRVHHEAPSLLHGDPARIRQVVCNLATTALKLTSSGALRVQVERELEDDERVLLRFTLVHSGLDASDADIAPILEAWSKADDAQARRQGGVSLSLAVARRLVANMEGEVGMSREGASGTRFWFRVPLDKQSSAHPVSAPAQAVQLRGLRVLVVDPADETRDESIGMLTAWGCRPEGVAHHSEALARMRAEAKSGEPFALAMIEMQLPEVDGAGLGRIIREDASLAGTRLMLMTGIGNRGDADRVREAGFSAYLLRPLTWSQIYDAVVDVMKAAPADPARDATRLVTRHSVAEARRSRVRILLVEDNQVNQLVAESVLQRLGYTVVKVSNGAGAIEAIERDQFDLILMDLQMPEVDGYRATAALRARERGRQRTPIVAMTGTATAEERRRCMDAGMDGYLSKPLDLGQLTALVEEFTQGEGVARLGTADVEPLAAETQPAAAGLDLVDAGGAAQEKSALDTARLEESCMGIPALRETLLRAFLDDVHPRVGRLRQAVQLRDARKIEFEAHGLKGMSATIGAAACADVFGRMEHLAREGELEPLVEDFARAEREVERVIGFVKHYDEILKRAA
jgi:PAS domain S-box-containing protein